MMLMSVNLNNYDQDLVLLKETLGSVENNELSIADHEREIARLRKRKGENEKKACIIAANVFTEEKIKSDSHRLLKSLSSIGLQAREDTYICCWHQNDYESEAMWQLYSNDIANAIAIQTTTRRLYVSIGKDPRIDIGKVSYIDFTKRFSSINGSFWYKRKAFEHEREVRAIIYDPQQKSSGIYIPCNINELIEKIYISPYAHKWFFDLVIEILKKYRIKKTVLQSELIQIPF